MAVGNNSVITYHIGEQPVVTALFTNAANTPTNPTTVTFQFVDPAGTQTNTASPNAAITNPTTGTFVFTWTGSTGVTVPGVYAWRVKGVGALISADEGTFTVLASTVPTP